MAQPVSLFSLWCFSHPLLFFPIVLFSNTFHVSLKILYGRSTKSSPLLTFTFFIHRKRLALFPSSLCLQLSPSPVHFSSLFFFLHRVFFLSEGNGLVTVPFPRHVFHVLYVFCCPLEMSTTDDLDVFWKGRFPVKSALHSLRMEVVEQYIRQFLICLIGRPPSLSPMTLSRVLFLDFEARIFFFFFPMPLFFPSSLTSTAYLEISL